MTKHIFWIASYPKSGNTLLRSILISLFFTEKGIFNLKMLNKIPQFESADFVYRNKKLFNEYFKKIHNINIFYKYILLMQKKKILGFSEDFKFFKTHSGNFSLGGFDFTKEKNIRGIIYIVRDPRDICVSWSKHLNISIDKSINVMINETQSILWNDNNERFLRKERPSSFLSSWEKHIISWTSTKWKVPLLIIKYEDLVYKKEIVIKKIIDFFFNNYGLNFINFKDKLPNIIKTTSFENFKKEEGIGGFTEAPKGKSFFSVGKKNQWKTKLNKEQVAKIEYKFRKTMEKFNYKIIS